MRYCGCMLVVTCTAAMIETVVVVRLVVVGGGKQKRSEQNEVSMFVCNPTHRRGHYRLRNAKDR